MENNAHILNTSEPLPNRMLKIRKLYWLCLVCTFLGVIYQPLLGIGIMGFLLVYCIHEFVLRVRTAALRDMKFMYGGLPDNELFTALQSVLLTQYQGTILMERNEKQEIFFTFDGHMYDLILHDDNTFSLWWRMGMAKAFLSLNDYKSYRKLLAGYGILAYHIQKCSTQLVPAAE